MRGACVPASAQRKPNLEGERVLAEFGRCVARAAPQEAWTVLETVPDSADEKGALEALFQKHAACMRMGPSLSGQQLAAEVSLGRTSLTSAASQLAGQQQTMAFRLRTLRRAVAEQLYLNMPKEMPLTAHVAASDSTGLPAGYMVVRCAAGLNPAAADDLVWAKRLSSREAEAARVLSPALTSCARGKGHVDMSGTAIHGWAAEALLKQRRADAAEVR